MGRQVEQFFSQIPEADAHKPPPVSPPAICRHLRHFYRHLGDRKHGSSAVPCYWDTLPAAYGRLVCLAGRDMTEPSVTQETGVGGLLNVEQGCIQLLLKPLFAPWQAASCLPHLSRGSCYPAFWAMPPGSICKYISQHHPRKLIQKCLQHAVVQVCRDTIPAFRFLLFRLLTVTRLFTTT